MTLNDWLGRLMLLVPVWPLIAVGSAILFYVRHLNRTSAERRVPAVLYVVALLASGAVSAFGGMVAGAGWACSRPQTGNLCGLVGVLVTGPIAGTVAIVLAGFALSRLGRDPAPEGQSGSRPTG